MKPYRVTVTQEWVLEAEAIVLASSEAEARTQAIRNVDFDIYDAEDNGSSAYAREMTLDQLLATRDLNKCFYEVEFIADSGSGFKSFDPEDFFNLDVFSEEALETARISRIERDNGQIDLPLVGGGALRATS